MQSGITASKELHEQFSSLLSSASTFALLVGIEREALVPTATVASTSSFSDDLASLRAHMEPKAATYAIVRRYETREKEVDGGSGGPELAAITYVPDAAPVRQKMLFASTRLTLTRELGLEHFRESMLFTTAEEFTEAGLEKHDAHVRLAAPLTEEERTLGEVKRAEQEAGGGTGAREIHLSKSLAMPVSEGALAALGEMAGAGGRVVTMLKINPVTETVELVPESSSPSSVAELSGLISKTEPRFTFFRFRYKDGSGAERSPVVFFYTCPQAAGEEGASGGGGGAGGRTKPIKQRMMYPLMKRAVLAVAEQEAGLKIEKRFEVEEPSEVTEELVMEELHPKVVTKQGFSRPKRPGR